MHRALPTTRRRAVPTAVVCALLLTACGSGGSSTGGSGLPTFSASAGTSTTTAPSASESASAEPEPDPSPWTALPTISEGPNKGVYSGIVLASSVAETDEEKAIVDGYVAFWKVLADIGLSARVDNTALAKVAVGTADSDLRDYAKGLRKQKAQTIGWASLNVISVTSSTGKGAFLKACADNGSFNVRTADGKPLEEPVAAIDAEAGLEKNKRGQWVVGYSKTTSRSKPCSTEGS